MVNLHTIKHMQWSDGCCEWWVLLYNVSHANCPPPPRHTSYLSVFQRISLLRSLRKGDCMQGLTIFFGKMSPFSSLLQWLWDCSVLVIVSNWLGWPARQDWTGLQPLNQRLARPARHDYHNWQLTTVSIPTSSSHLLSLSSHQVSQ